MMVHINLGRNKRDFKATDLLGTDQGEQGFCLRGGRGKDDFVSPHLAFSILISPCSDTSCAEPNAEGSCMKTTGDESASSIMYKELQGILKDKQQQKGPAEFFGGMKLKLSLASLSY